MHGPFMRCGRIKNKKISLQIWPTLLALCTSLVTMTCYVIAVGQSRLQISARSVNFFILGSMFVDDKHIER